MPRGKANPPVILSAAKDLIADERAVPRECGPGRTTLPVILSAAKDPITFAPLVLP